MENFPAGEQFLHQRDPKLHTQEAVFHEQQRKRRAGEEISQKPLNKISDWMKVLERTHVSHRNDPRVIERIKQYYYKEHVIKPENIPESTFLLEQKIARNMGYGDVEITEEFKTRKTEQIINDQKRSLDQWLDYLTSDDAIYPTWAKYWAFKSVVSMGKFEKTEDEHGKESSRFADRTPDTTASFPPLNPRALAMAIGVLRSKLEQKQKPKKEQVPTPNISKKLSDQEFQQLLSTESFPKLYAQFLAELPEYSREGLQETRGKWVQYSQGSSPDQLVKSLEGHPLEWCTANIDTARDQLQGGDFYVYYSINESGEAVIPRAAIRMQDNSIAEVRGIAAKQNLDPYIGEVLETKLKDFGHEADTYKKKNHDMKLLTELEKKTEQNQPLTKDDLLFLYEIDNSIEGYGYQKDPRIKELQTKRNPEADMLTIFECSKDQIAHTKDEINERTKVYLGKLEKDIFQKLQQFNIEHIYTSFPESKIKRYHIEIGGKSKKELITELKQKNINISDYAQDMMDSKDFSTSKTKETTNLIRLSVGDLGFPSGATTEQIYERAKQLGLELCPAEVGPHLRLKDSSSDLMWIAMKQISDRDGSPNVFKLGRNGDGLWLHSDWANPGSRWNSVNQFVFRSRSSV